MSAAPISNRKLFFLSAHQQTMAPVARQPEQTPGSIFFPISLHISQNDEYYRLIQFVNVYRSIAHGHHMDFFLSIYWKLCQRILIRKANILFYANSVKFVRSSLIILLFKHPVSSQHCAPLDCSCATQTYTQWMVKEVAKALCVCCLERALLFSGTAILQNHMRCPPVVTNFNCWNP